MREHIDTHGSKLLPFAFLGVRAEYIARRIDVVVVPAHCAVVGRMLPPRTRLTPSTK